MSEVTFRDFRKVAQQQGWTGEYLIEQCRSELDKPTETIRRILEGATVEGHRYSLKDGVWVFS